MNNKYIVGTGVAGLMALSFVTGSITKSIPVTAVTYEKSNEGNLIVNLTTSVEITPEELTQQLKIAQQNLDAYDEETKSVMAFRDEERQKRVDILDELQKQYDAAVSLNIPIK